MKVEKFWIVWKITGGSPSQIHKKFIEAKKEAERLARSQPGEFAVMELVGIAKQEQTPVSWEEAG